MTAPRVGAVWFGWACLIGAALGLMYGFLRPLRPRHTVLADTVFVAAAFFGWIYWGFGICGAEVRIAGLPGMALGCIGWECTAGRLLRPVFAFFWGTIGKLWDILLRPTKKIL